MSAKGDESQAIGDDFEATVFADFLIDFLKKGTLTGVHLKDERFGNVDDIVFELNNNILFCLQAKGSKTYRDITLGSFFTIPKGKKKSILRNLYETSISLKKKFKDHLIRISYITNKPASSSTATLPRKGNRKITLASFIRDVWKPFKNNRISKEEILKDKLNEEFIERFREHLIISPDELWEFFEKFDFIFDYPASRTRTEREFQEIEKFYLWFLKNKKNPEVKGYISVDRLLRDLEILRISQPHDFPIEKLLYVSFPDIKNTIIKGIHKLEKGYLFLKGGPNTGKSTFLEAEFNNKTSSELLIFKYLCFREPNELSFRSRGELTNFINDLNNQIRLYIKKISGQDIMEQFIENLQEISKFGEKEGKKIVIIIDGIDHVTREELYRLDKPFTSYLLKPESLPKNIVFLISGQHFQSIHWYNSLKTSKFCMSYEMHPFSINQIRIYLKGYYKLEEEIKFHVIEKLFNKTQGNPMYLRLICQYYENIEDLYKNIEDIEKNFLDFESNWNELYDKYWKFFGFDKRAIFKTIAGLISRIYGPIDLKWLNMWPEKADIEKFIQKFEFCFKKYSNILLFDQNSFNNYLQKKSISFVGIESKEEELDFFNTLALRCEINGLESYSSWFKLRYVINAEKIENFKLDRNYFIQHWLQGRNLSDIAEDILILLEYYVNNNDFEMVFEIIHLKLEFNLRKEINKLDTKPGYIFFVNPIYEHKSSYVFYLISVILQSLDVSPSFKLDFILFMIDRFNLTDKKELFLLIKRYFERNKQNWIEVFYNPDYDENLTKKWLKVALFFENDSNKIIQDFNNFLLAKYEDYLFQGSRWRYYPIIRMMGEFLIENSRFDSLEIIYRILNNLIEQDEWEIIQNETVFFKNKDQTEFYVNEKDNPFYLVLELKLRESKVKGKKIIDAFLKDNQKFQILFDKSDFKHLYKLFYDDITEDDLFYRMDFGFTVEKSYSSYGKIQIKNRLHLYRVLNEEYELNEYKLLSLFNNEYEKRNLKDRINSDSIKFQWEKLFYEFAIQLNSMYNNLEEAKPLTSVIIKLFEKLGNRNNYITEKRVRILINFSLIMDIVIESIIKYPFLYEWFQNKIFKYMKKNYYGFNNIMFQVAVLNLIHKHLKELNYELVKWVIVNTKNNYFDGGVNYWNFSSLIYDVLRILNILKPVDRDFYNNNFTYFQNKLKIYSFRMYPRKDWQLYHLVYLLKNIISYFPQDDKKLIEKIEWLVNMLNYSENITERAEIFAIKERFHESIHIWNSELADKIYFQLNLHLVSPRNYDSQEKYEEIEIDDSFIDDILDVFEEPSEFLAKIVDFAEGLSFEQKYYSKNFKKIIDKLEQNKETTIEVWRRFFDFLIAKGKERSIWELSGSTFIECFIEFYRKKIRRMKLKESEIHDIELKIELAKLGPPDREISIRSLENLYQLDKEKCFDHGWKLIRNLLIKRRKPMWHAIFSGFIAYTFLSIIKSDNYIIYWNIYLKYLKNLFEIMDQ